MMYTETIRIDTTPRPLKSRLGGMLAGLLLAFGSTLSTLASAQETVVISSGEWAPYTSENLENYGIGPHIISAAFAKVGINVEYRWYPWTRAMQEAEDSSVDFSGIWYYNEDRASRFAYTEPVVSSSNVFFHRKDREFDWSDFESFPDVTIGRTATYSYGQAFDEAAEAGKVQIEEAPSDLLNFRKLIRGRIDAFPAPELVGFDMLKGQFTPTEAQMITAHPKALTEAPLHLIAARDNARAVALIEQYNEGRRLLIQSGELQEILNSYR